jgi:hypothetical protein
MSLKNTFIAALMSTLISTIALPVFAQTATPDQEPNDAMTTELAQSNDYSTQNDTQMESEARRPQPPRRPHQPHQQPGYPGGGHGGPGYPPDTHWVCYSHDFFGRQYYGQGWSVDQARRVALRTCQAYSQTPITVCFDDGCQMSY